MLEAAEQVESEERGSHEDDENESDAINDIHLEDEMVDDHTKTSQTAEYQTCFLESRNGLQQPTQRMTH